MVSLKTWTASAGKLASRSTPIPPRCLRSLPCEYCSPRLSTSTASSPASASQIVPAVYSITERRRGTAAWHWPAACRVRIPRTRCATLSIVPQPALAARFAPSTWDHRSGVISASSRVSPAAGSSVVMPTMVPDASGATSPTSGSAASCAAREGTRMGPARVHRLAALTRARR